MTAPVEWITAWELIDSIPSRIGTLTETDAADWITEALDDIIDVAVLPAAPTSEQVEAVRRAIIAYVRWKLETGGAVAGITIGHVSIPSTSASASAVTDLPAKVFTILRNAGLLRVTRASAY